MDRECPGEARLTVVKMVGVESAQANGGLIEVKFKQVDQRMTVQCDLDGRVLSEDLQLRYGLVRTYNGRGNGGRLRCGYAENYVQVTAQLDLEQSLLLETLKESIIEVFPKELIGAVGGIKFGVRLTQRQETEISVSLNDHLSSCSLHVSDWYLCNFQTAEG